MVLPRWAGRLRRLAHREGDLKGRLLVVEPGQVVVDADGDAKVVEHDAEPVLAWPSKLVGFAQHSVDHVVQHLNGPFGRSAVGGIGLRRWGIAG